MDAQQIALVQDSFAKIEPISDTASAIFYKRLFSLKPELETLFTGDMYLQGSKLMNMLGMVVKGLTRLDDLIPTIEELGKRHVDYGVTEEMYPAVGEALLWTLEKGLSEAFTEEVRLAWHAAYSTLQSVMCEAAKSSVS